jgi:hypothetical protein
MLSTEEIKVRCAKIGSTMHSIAATKDSDLPSLPTKVKKAHVYLWKGTNYEYYYQYRN